MSNRDNIEITLITENDRERMEQVAQMETDVFPDPWSYHEVRSTVRQKHTFCAAAMEGDIDLSGIGTESLKCWLFHCR